LTPQLSRQRGGTLIGAGGVEVSEVRRARLEGLIGPDGAIVFSEALEVDGAVLFAKACELGVEGVVSKRRGGVYLSGPCRNWLKIKNSAFARG
jgi:bifunctional non-homologous end joining protein LigD